MKVNGINKKEMEQESNIILMVQFMKVIGVITNMTDLVELFMQMENII